MTELRAPLQDEMTPPAPNGFGYESQDDLWDYTANSRDALGDIFKGRFQIGRDTQIDGGVYTGTYGGEAIVVDTGKYPKEFNDYLDEVKTKSQDKDGRIDRSLVLGAVFDTVASRMEYSQSGVDDLLQDTAAHNGKQSFEDYSKVTLNSFMKRGIGVCRHMALTTATLLEKMKAEGYIRGTVSVERSQRFNPKGEREGHAWTRYTSHSGEVVILDVAQGFIGFLEESEEQGWNYMRPEEQQAKAIQDARAAVDNIVEHQPITELPSGPRYDKPSEKNYVETQDLLNALTRGLSDEDATALWNYAAGIVNSDIANRQGLTQEARNEGQRANEEGLLKMSPNALNQKDTYLHLFRKLNDLR